MNRQNFKDAVGRDSYALVTLGCKSNQYDSAAMAADLAGSGMVSVSPEGAGMVIVNTCMVTGPTEAQCRKEIRRIKRKNPDSFLIVTGCMSKGASRSLSGMAEIDLVLDMEEKGRLVSILGILNGEDWVDWPDVPAVAIEGRDRGFLKIQDGCDFACSYCIVPSVRGSSRSLAPEKVLKNIRNHLENGVEEVVLTGIHLGLFGRDLTPPGNLEALLKDFLKQNISGRVRLSSLEPLEITDALLDLIAGSGGRICRHLHIPLQSGSDRILGLMDRPYKREDFIDAVNRARSAVPGIGIGCDVICGFPAETDEDFAKTEELINIMEIPFVHVFPFSSRPGTRAASMKDDVPHTVKKERAAQLRKHGKRNLAAFMDSLVGEELIVIPEPGSVSSSGMPALADNYVRVVLDGDGTVPGHLVRVKCEERVGEMLSGKILSDDRAKDTGDSVPGEQDR